MAKNQKKRRPLVDPPSTVQGGQRGGRRQHGHGHAHHLEHCRGGEKQPETSHTHAGFQARFQNFRGQINLKAMKFSLHWFSALLKSRSWVLRLFRTFIQ